MKIKITETQFKKLTMFQPGNEIEVNEKKKKDDRCTRIAKRKYDTWPSAYASGAVVKCRAGKIWKDLKEEDLKEKTDFSKEKSKGLHGWFERQGAPGKTSGWVDCNTCKDGKCKPCGRSKGEKRKKPRCRPTPSACKGFKNESVIEEAEYRGRKVKLIQPTRGDVKKFKVYVKNDKDNVVKVNFGQKGVRIKKNDPDKRRSFRARHNCDNPGPKWKARYWSCKKW